MKKLVAIAAFCCAQTLAFSQWTGSNPATLTGSAFMSGELTMAGCDAECFITTFITSANSESS